MDYTLECKTCNQTKNFLQFSVSKISAAGKTYRHKECMECRRSPCGFEPRLTTDEKVRMLEYEDDYNNMSGKGFYDLMDFQMNTQQFYRYRRDGSIKKFYEKHGKKKPTA